MAIGKPLSHGDPDAQKTIQIIARAIRKSGSLGVKVENALYSCLDPADENALTEQEADFLEELWSHVTEE